MVSESGCRKPLVSNSAAESSPYCDGSSAARTASVSRCRPGGSCFFFTFTLSRPKPSGLFGIRQRQARPAFFQRVFLPHARFVDLLDVVRVDVARDVHAVEARRIEAVELGIQRTDRALHPLDVLVDQRVAVDDLADLLDGA